MDILIGLLLVAISVFFLLSEYEVRHTSLWEILTIVSGILAILLTVVAGSRNCCPNCHQVSDGRYCTYCGYDKHPPNDELICPACGNVARLGDVYCKNCGAYLVVPTEPAI